MKGEEFYFDLEDYDKIKDYCWCINTQGYVCSNTKGVFLHRLVTECEDGMVVDHKYGTQTKNDNRKMNLRVCTQHQNSMNNKIPKNNTSGVTGVGWFKNRNKWYARIMVNYKNVHLGYFDNFNDAVRARKEAELKYFGEYSYGYYSQSKEVI